MRKLLAGIVAATGLLAAVPASAETTECTVINTLPYVITVQGVYCFKQHLGTAITSGNAITINANNVTIDFNGFKLGGLAAGPTTTATGVYALDRKNITLRGGNIRGFFKGVFLSQGAGDSSGHIIEDNLFDGNTADGMNIDGSGIQIRNNSIVNTDSTVPAGPSGHATASSTRDAVNGFGNGDYGNGSQNIPLAGSGGEAAAIRTNWMTDSIIINNVISKTITPVDVFGMALVNLNNVEVSLNSVFETSAGGYTSGVYLKDSNDVLFKENNLIEGQSTTNTAIGIEMSNSTNVVCSNNTVISFADGPTFGCTSELGTFPPAGP